MASNPGVLLLRVHATPPNATESIVLASNAGDVGAATGETDLRVIKTGEARLRINEAGDRLEISETLNDVSGGTLGAIDIGFAHAKGQPTTRREQQVAAAVQGFFQRHVMTVANLLDPYPYSTEFSDDNAAQALVDTTMARHPELLLLGMHVSLPGRGNYMLGSNIGRIGKKGDEDDMRVVTTGEPNLDVSGNGKRFHIELVLHDRAGRNIGALATAFQYKAGDDKAALIAQAERIRDEMAREIPSAASLAARATASLRERSWPAGKWRNGLRDRLKSD